MTMLMGWVLKNQAAAKITGGLAGAGGVLSLIFALHSDIKQEMQDADMAVKQYVDLRIENIDNKASRLEDGQKEIKDLLKTIDKRLYDLKTK